MKKPLFSKATLKRDAYYNPPLSPRSERTFTVAKPHKKIFKSEQNVLLKAMDDINRKLIKRTDWKQQKHTMAEMQNTQEDKIKEMEDQKKRNLKVISVLKEDKRESKKKWEDRVQKMEEEMKEKENQRKEEKRKFEEEKMELTREKHALSQKYYQLSTERLALLQKFNSAEQRNEVMHSNMKATEQKIARIEHRFKDLEDERRKERRKWEDERSRLSTDKEDLSQKFLSAREKSDMMKSRMKTKDTKVLRKDEKIKDIQEERRGERRRWEEEKVQMTKEKQDVSQRFHLLIKEKQALSQQLQSAEQKNEDMHRKTKTTEDMVQKMEERIKHLEGERREESKAWEEERLQLTREKEDATQKLQLKTTESKALKKDERIKSLGGEKDERKKWEVENIELANENVALAQKLLSAEQTHGNVTSELKATVQRMREMMEHMEEQRREERRRWEEQRIQLTRENEDLSHKFRSACSPIKRTRSPIMESKIRDMEDEREEKKRWQEEKVHLIKDKEALARRLLASEQKNENLTNELHMTVRKLEDKIKGIEGERSDERRKWAEDKKRCEGEKALLTKEKQSLVQLLSPVQHGEFTKRQLAVSELTLDPNTAHRNLTLSDHNRTVTRVRDNQAFPDHQDRFDSWEQVLCREGLTGRYYWDIEWSGRVSIAVTYRGIHRKGLSGDCGLGFNDRSWSLECYELCHCKRYSIRHDRRLTKVPFYPSISNRIGVYLDWDAGTLSFYRVCTDSRTHLYTIQTTFTEALYPGFLFGSDSSVSLQQIEEIH